MSAFLQGDVGGPVPGSTERRQWRVERLHGHRADRAKVHRPVGGVQRRGAHHGCARRFNGFGTPDARAGDLLATDDAVGTPVDRDRDVKQRTDAMLSQVIAMGNKDARFAGEAVLQDVVEDSLANVCI